MNLRLLGQLACVVLLSITSAPVISAQDPQDVSSAWSEPESPCVLKIDKTFANGLDQLSGTLYVPSVSHRVPAVVAFHGASTPTREAPLFRHLEQMLPQLGVAVFVYDRRGSGKSVGKPAHGDYGLLADDGLAAAANAAEPPPITTKQQTVPDPKQSSERGVRNAHEQTVKPVSESSAEAGEARWTISARRKG